MEDHWSSFDIDFLLVIYSANNDMYVPSITILRQVLHIDDQNSGQVIPINNFFTRILYKRKMVSIKENGIQKTLKKCFET